MSGVVVWFTGRPASGKSRLATDVASALEKEGTRAVVLDGDEVRDALVPPLGYENADRDHFYETLSRLAGLLAKQGHVVLVPATANRTRYRQQARAFAPSFIEVYVLTPAVVCAERDIKGLYEQAAAGRIKNVPGVGTEYEEPNAPDIVAPGGTTPDVVARILEKVALVR